MVRTPGFHPGNRSSILLWAANFWPIRLVVRTPGFHPGNRSSILLWAAFLNKIKLVIMANHKSALKRVRSDETKRLLGPQTNCGEKDCWLRSNSEPGASRKAGMRAVMQVMSVVPATQVVRSRP